MTESGRTLFEIIESTKDGEKPTYDEAYFAMLVLTSLLNMATADVGRAADDSASLLLRRMKAQEAHHRYQQALNTSPCAYLGDNVPGNPAYDKWREIGNRLLDRLLTGNRDEEAGDA